MQKTRLVLFILISFLFNISNFSLLISNENLAKNLVYAESAGTEEKDEEGDSTDATIQTFNAKDYLKSYLTEVRDAYKKYKELYQKYYTEIGVEPSENSNNAAYFYEQRKSRMEDAQNLVVKAIGNEAKITNENINEKIEINETLPKQLFTRLQDGVEILIERLDAERDEYEKEREKLKEQVEEIREIYGEKLKIDSETVRIKFCTKIIDKNDGLKCMRMVNDETEKALNYNASFVINEKNIFDEFEDNVFVDLLKNSTSRSDVLREKKDMDKLWEKTKTKYIEKITTAVEGSQGGGEDKLNDEILKLRIAIKVYETGTYDLQKKGTYELAQEKLNTAKEKVNNLKDERKNLTGNLTKTKEAIAKLQNEIKALKKADTKNEDEKKKNKEAIKSKEELLEKLEEAAEQEEKALEEKLEEAYKNLEDAQEDFDKAEKNLAKLKIKLAEKLKEKDSLKNGVLDDLIDIFNDQCTDDKCTDFAEIIEALEYNKQTLEEIINDIASKYEEHINQHYKLYDDYEKKYNNLITQIKKIVAGKNKMMPLDPAKYTQILDDLNFQSEWFVPKGASPLLSDLKGKIRSLVLDTDKTETDVEDIFKEIDTAVEENTEYGKLKSCVEENEDFGFILDDFKYNIKNYAISYYENECYLDINNKNFKVQNNCDEYAEELQFNKEVYNDEFEISREEIKKCFSNKLSAFVKAKTKLTTQSGTIEMAEKELKDAENIDAITSALAKKSKAEEKIKTLENEMKEINDQIDKKMSDFVLYDTEFVPKRAYLLAELKKDKKEYKENKDKLLGQIAYIEEANKLMKSLDNFPKEYKVFVGQGALPGSVQNNENAGLGDVQDSLLFFGSFIFKWSMIGGMFGFLLLGIVFILHPYDPELLTSVKNWGFYIFIGMFFIFASYSLVKLVLTMVPNMIGG